MNVFTWALILAIPILPNLWCIWHAFTHEFPGENEQKLWIRAGIFLPVLGGLAYLFYGRRRALPPGKRADS